MTMVAGINLPCTDCAHRFKRCGYQVDVFGEVFFAIGRGTAAVECRAFEAAWYHGLEGVKQ